MKNNYDFPKGVRGKFYRGNKPFQIMIHNVSKRTLTTIDSSMKNLRKGVVSEPVDLFAFSGKSQKRWRLFIQ